MLISISSVEHMTLILHRLLKLLYAAKSLKLYTNFGKTITKCKIYKF